MTELIQRAKNKLDDPILREWALDLYKANCSHSPDVAEEMLRIWFDDLSLSKWLKTECADNLSSLFNTLPPKCFKNLHQILFEQWPNWAGAAARYSIPALIQSENGVERALLLFQQHVSNHFDIHEKTLGIIDHLVELPKTLASPMLANLIEKTLDLPDDAWFKSSYLGHLLLPVVKLNLDVTEQLFSALLKSKLELKHILKHVNYALNGNNSCYDLAQWIQEGCSQQTFESLMPLFSYEAPLAEVDEILRSENLFPLSRALLESHRDRSPITELTDHLILSVYKKVDKDALPALGLLGLTSLLISFVKDTVDFSHLSLTNSIALLSADLSNPIQKEALIDHIKTFELSDIVNAIESRFSELKDSYGVVHLANLVGELRLFDFIPTLIDLLKKDEEDFICEGAQAVLFKLGKPAQAAIIECWDEMDFSQQIYGASVIRNVGTKAAVDFAIDRYETLFFEELESWCELVLSMPDKRSVELLQPQLKREQFIIDKTYYQLCRLLDIETENLAGVHNRIEQVRMEEQARLTASNSRGQPLRDHIKLSLRCKECGVENQYNIKKILVSDSSDDPGIIVDEFPCASCESWSDFEFTSNAYMAMSVELLLLQANQDKGDDSWSPLQLANCIYRGERTTIPEVIAKLEFAVKQFDRIEDNIELARTNSLAGRLRRARVLYKQVQDREPNAMEAGLGLATIDEKEGHSEQAFDRLQQLLERKQAWCFYRSHRLPLSVLGKEFAQLYNKLLKRLNKNGLPILHDSFLGNNKKIGRNDPCPCGSRKKFKKCCLLKS